MEFWHVVGDITVLLGVAVLLGIFAERLGLSAVVGYLLAGTIVGPGLLNWISSDEQTLRSIAEIGVALLLFTIGLEVNSERLKQLLGRGVVVGILQVVVTGCLGYAVAKIFGASSSSAIIVGSMAALSSTAVVARVLQDRSELDSTHGRLAFGILLVQDLAIVPLMLLVGLLSKTTGDQGVALQIGTAGAKFAALVVIVFLVGILIMPRLFGAAIIRRSNELPVIVGLVTCLSAIWLAHQLHLSPALGAFIAGLILARSPFTAQLRGDMAPLKHIFLTLFFAATGMLADLPWLIVDNHWVWVICVAVGIVGGKSIIVWLVGMVCKQPRRIAIAAGLCLSQIGEFSFVIGAEGMKFGLITDDQFQLMITSSLLTLLAAPLMISKARKISKRIDSAIGRSVNIEEDEQITSTLNHIIVIGYGVAGRQVVVDLLESNQQVIVIEIGSLGVKQAREDGALVILGNAQQREILEYAGVRNAKLVVSALPDHRTSTQMIQQIRAFAPTVPLIARARYSRHGFELTNAGADIVVDEEKCVGESLSLQVLQQVGL